MRGPINRPAILLGLLVLAGTAMQAQTPAPVAVPTPSPQATQAPGETSSSGVRQRKRPGSADSRGSVNASLSKSTGPAVAPAPGVLVDQIIAIVNGDLVLESDIDQERSFENFEPFSAPAPFDRDKAVERLIDRTLILQQAKLEPEQADTKEQAQQQLQALRKDLPACKAYHCETDAGWEKFVHDHGFTQESLLKRWQQRVDILNFIEMRFRSGIEITPAQIKTYYEGVMLPEYTKVNATAPKLAVISDRIQEVLLEQQVSALLSDWLKSLKAQGTVRVIRPGEVQP